MSFYVASSYWEGSFRIISFYVYPFLCDILSIAYVTSSSKGEWLTVFIYFLGSSCHLLYLRECFFCFPLLCELPVNMFNCSSPSMKLNLFSDYFFQLQSLSGLFGLYNLWLRIETALIKCAPIRKLIRPRVIKFNQVIAAMTSHYLFKSNVLIG